jgi:hypothetical protein
MRPKLAIEPIVSTTAKAPKNWTKVRPRNAASPGPLVDMSMMRPIDIGIAPVTADEIKSRNIATPSNFSSGRASFRSLHISLGKFFQSLLSSFPSLCESLALKSTCAALEAFSLLWKPWCADKASLSASVVGSLIVTAASVSLLPISWPLLWGPLLAEYWRRIELWTLQGEPYRREMVEERPSSFHSRGPLLTGARVDIALVAQVMLRSPLCVGWLRTSQANECKEKGCWAESMLDAPRCGSRAARRTAPQAISLRLSLSKERLQGLETASRWYSHDLGEKSLVASVRPFWVADEMIP